VPLLVSLVAEGGGCSVRPPPVPPSPPLPTPPAASPPLEEGEVEEEDMTRISRSKAALPPTPHLHFRCAPGGRACHHAARRPHASPAASRARGSRPPPPTLPLPEAAQAPSLIMRS
jgi:hypothetical protein